MSGDSQGHNSASIRKLLITGVRSFDNKDPETIQFYAPLTLIVGSNGSGKTTIIECLKYATTGDLPPNSVRGGAFIHDPKICGEKDVHAQVKLTFDDTKGSRNIVSRSLQLTVKKNTRQQKTLEGSLVINTNGEKSVMSKRNAEMDLLVPLNLGVSKAILDSVIFCHQEESLWPMSEPGTLKKRFDEIFEAQKYTKAIAAIKDEKKQQGVKLKVLSTEEQTCKERKAQGDRDGKVTKQLVAEVAVLKKEISELDVKTKEADEKYRAAFNKASGYKGVVETLKLNRQKQEWHEKNIRDLSRDLQERKESDESLQNELDQYEERVVVHEQKKQQQTKQYESLRKGIDQAQEKLRGKHVEAGKHEEQKANHEQNTAKRKALVNESSIYHNILGYERDLDDMQIQEFIEKMSKLSKEQNAAVQKVRKETEREMRKAQEVLSKLGERRSALNQSRNSSKQQIVTNDRKIRDRQSEMNSIDFDEGDRARIEANVEDLGDRLKKAKDEFRNSQWDKKTQDRNAELRALEEESERLNRELVQGTKQAKDLARFDYLKKEVADRQRSLDTMKSVYNERLQILLNHDWQPSSLEADFQEVLDSRSRKVKDTEQQRGVVARNLDQIDFELRKAQRDLKNANEECDASVKYLSEKVAGEPEEYHANLSLLQESRDVLKSDVDNFENKRKYFQQAVKLAKEQHKCKLCTRAFHGNKEQVDFVQQMEALIAKGALAETQKELEIYEVDLRAAKEAGPRYDTWVRLSTTELPRLERLVKDLKTKRKDVVVEYEEHDKMVSDTVRARTDADSLSNNVKKIAKDHQDILNFSSQIQELAAKQEDTGMAHTLEEIQGELESVGGKLRDMRSTIARLTADKERARTEMSTFELDLSKAKNTLSNANHQLARRADISARIEEVRKASREQQDTIQDLEKEVSNLIPQIAAEETKLDDIRRRGGQRERDLQQGASKLSDTVHRLSLATLAIQAYIDEGGPAKLLRCRRETESLEQETRQTEEEQQRIIVSINTLNRELSSHTETKRTILENIKYRQSLRELEDVKAEIAQLSAQNAEADQEHWDKQASRWQKKHEELSTLKTSKLGTSRAKDDEVARLVANWETDYKDAAKLFKEAHIKVQATTAAIDDLGRYGGALDKAIMSFHTIKMGEINRIIEELWKKTYQGTDVDSILIRSENATGQGNRSYNYGVCMVKQDVEMDMRGRCSAGQKVLASIIIRLALAECFGVSCGIIALDEPTTNLDRDNIRSLAIALHDLIQSRRHQANFQLIVITHDEEFLQFMKCPEFCDYYFRVSRNDRQKSIIERQSIHEVM